MAGKFGKFLLFSAAAGAAAYGAYCYLKKEKVITPVVEDDDASVSFDDDLDGEPTKARSYVNLQFDKARAEDLAKNAVKKAKETINDSMQKVEEFFNDEPNVVADIKDPIVEDVDLKDDEATAYSASSDESDNTVTE